jgi:DNA repair exonuclease SbcCD ATPase subunit
VIITECVLHGFKRFAEPFTLRLKPGVNLVTGGNESGKSTLCEAILSALFASPSSSAFLNWSHPEVCRLLLVFSTPRGLFRAVKDFVRHSADFSTWDPAQATFLSATQDPSQVAGLLSKAIGGVTEAVYRTLCALQPPRQLPTPQAPNLTSSVDPSTAPISPGSCPETQKERLQQLRGYLKTHQEIQETELLLDTLRTQHNETCASLQRLVALEEERRKVREALEPLEPLASLATASLLPQITEYQQALESRNGAVRELEEKIEEEHTRLALIPSIPLFRHRLFLIGGGLLILSFVAAQFLSFLSAGIFVGLGCIAVALTQYLNWSQNRDKIQRSLLALEYQVNTGLELRISRQFQSLLDLLPSTGCREVPDLAKRLQQRDTLREKLTILDQQIAELSTGTDPVALEEKRRELEEAIQLGEGELRALGFVPEPREVQREIEKLERAALSPEKPVLPSREHSSQTVDTFLAPLEKLLGGLNTSLLSAVETQASKLITEITAERYTRIRRDPENGLRLVLAGSQGERSLGEVSDGTQEQAVLAWHLALLSTFPQASVVPLLLDDPLLRVDGERRRRLLPLLQSLSRTHQVILFSHEAWIPSAMAHIVPLAGANDCLPSSVLA